MREFFLLRVHTNLLELCLKGYDDDDDSYTVSENSSVRFSMHVWMLI